ncbi:hypothetical protein [Thalassovita sp.]|uniref:hypothetical protein n=1 Tax=Thalassovita sp. TaxID=1979401 RepID=UPI002881FE57|nr:hypothetical protein [Thalassovita sp.]MDF1802513.1 hypothetical protein [Thalassovita sp.]
MKRILGAAVLAGMMGVGSGAIAGGETVLTPTTIGNDAATSSGGGVILPLILLAIIAAAVAAD